MSYLSVYASNVLLLPCTIKINKQAKLSSWHMHFSTHTKLWSVTCGHLYNAIFVTMLMSSKARSSLLRWWTMSYCWGLLDFDGYDMSTHSQIPFTLPLSWQQLRAVRTRYEGYVGILIVIYPWQTWIRMAICKLAVLPNKYVLFGHLCWNVQFQKSNL